MVTIIPVYLVTTATRISGRLGILEFRDSVAPDVTVDTVIPAFRLTPLYRTSVWLRHLGFPGESSTTVFLVTPATRIWGLLRPPGIPGFCSKRSFCRIRYSWVPDESYTPEFHMTTAPRWPKWLGYLGVPCDSGALELRWNPAPRFSRGIRHPGFRSDPGTP